MSLFIYFSFHEYFEFCYARKIKWNALHWYLSEVVFTNHERASALAYSRLKGFDYTKYNVRMINQSMNQWVNRNLLNAANQLRIIISGLAIFWLQTIHDANMNLYVCVRAFLCMFTSRFQFIGIDSTDKSFRNDPNKSFVYVYFPSAKWMKLYFCWCNVWRHNYYCYKVVLILT